MPDFGELQTPISLAGFALMWWRLAHLEGKRKEDSAYLRRLGAAVLLISVGKTDEARAVFHGRE